MLIAKGHAGDGVALFNMLVIVPCFVMQNSMKHL